MREGLDQDDLYMMVEDEFYSVAQSFTQHLHHAEYLRLKNLAKARGISGLGTGSRPTDSVTEMREELKKKKQAEAQAEKHKQALAKLGGGVARKRVKLSGDEANDSETEEDDLWAGTTLKGLMASPSKMKTSLMGLQGQRSSTRAAAGYSPPKAPGSKPNVTFDMSTSIETRKQAKGRDASSQATASDDDDDLDAPIQGPREQPAFQSIEKDLSFQTASRAKPTAAKSSTSDRRSRQSAVSVYDRKYRNALLSSPSENESEDRPTLSKLPLSRISRPLKKSSHAEAKAEPKSYSNVNEIPIFLV